MKIRFLPLLMLLVALACSQSSALPTPTTEPIPQTIPTDLPTALPAVPTTEPTPTADPFPGTPITFGNVTLVIPPGLATGILGTEIPAASGENVAPWEIAPAHIQLTLEGYALQDKFHQPRLFIYPAEAYAALDEGVANNLAFIKGVCCRASNVPDPASLPHIPFFNAGQVFAANIQLVPFQNGSGVRFLTEYAQYFATVNNTDLFYHYQGLTEDGQYYILVILPVTAPLLAADANPESAVPAGGVPHPSFDDPNADWAGYYTNIAALLDTTAPNLFGPTLAQLDALIRSIQIAP
ncbi:MAG: hypothetical protein HUU38_26785 [Anaerolineales bacterium]|nr:hypothetical protein [Anaerolineales bacterium]